VAAVPEVVTTTTGRPVVLAIPSAKNAAERSSWWDQSSMDESARATERGLLRYPGAMHASSTPEAASAATSVRENSVLRSVTNATVVTI